MQDSPIIEVVRKCVNPDCFYVEFGFQAGSAIELYRDAEQHALLCALEPYKRGETANECPFWKRSSPEPMPPR